MSTPDSTVASSERQSRRSLLKGAVGSVTAVGVVSLTGASALSLHVPIATAAQRQSPGCVTPIIDILTIARTAERLAVTFYSNAIKNADRLGLHGDDLDVFRAALIEEQIHEKYLRDAGGNVLTSTFSFPHGPDTFRNKSLLIATQQQLEGVFDSAYLSAVREFAAQDRPDLALIAAQVATIEAEHRTLGRAILGLKPADNWAFSPVLLSSVADAPELVKKAGYLSPKKGNSYTYKDVGTKDDRIKYRKPYSVACSEA